MPDIRSFFAPKGGAAPAKPVPKKEDDSAKKNRSRRKVIDDSDDDFEAPVEAKKPSTKATPKKKSTGSEPAKGVPISASDYFASSKGSVKSKAPSTQTTPKATPNSTAKTRSKPGIEVRMSPRSKPKPASTPVNTPPKPPQPGARKRATTSYAKYEDDDEDAYMDDDADGGDDIFTADVKGRNKRKNDGYVDDDSDEEMLPKPKRIASRGKVLVKDEPEAPSSSKKRKSVEHTEDEDEEEDAAPRKRAAPAKPRAPRAKKDAEPEDANIQSIMDNVPTVQAPDAPPKDPNAKFDWRKAAAGGGNSGPPPNSGAADIPDGAANCLMGKAFVFTGLLKTLGRDEAQALVKRYGGKVTGAPSGKTDFVVLGDDAGPSKLRKIKDLGIKTIDEEGLFYLIRTMPAHGGSGKGAEKAKQKQEEDQKKIKQQAEDMEKEEKARRLETEKAKKKAAAARGVAPPTQARPVTQLWTSKYAPSQLSHICGNKANVEKIQNWLKNWPKSKKYDFQRRGADGMGGARAIIISGPPGIGKTTAAHLAANLEGYDVLESNASDSRSKKLVENGIGDVLNNTSLLGYFAGDGKKADATKKKIVLIMDEVDGMSAGDRGGVGALAKFCKTTEVPLILICNERRLPKMKPFDFVTFDIKFTRPTIDQIRSRVMTICHREGLKLPPPVVDALIEGSNRDIRQVINMISTAKLDQSSMDFDQGKEMSKAWQKHIILKPWDICQALIAGGLFSPASKSTLNDKIELYFNDHEFSFLMIQENYLRTKPALLTGKGYTPREERLKYLELVDQAAESISDGDLVDRMIHGPQQQWSLMPTHAVFSAVRPSSFIAGQMLGSNFTSWLGNNSKTGKLGRFVREIQSHMRLRSSGDHNEVRQQYLPVLWYQIVKRLEVEGRDAADEVIDLMDSYFLTRDDFDAIKELGVGPQAEEKINIETQTKSAFTRLYNSRSHPLPFMKATTTAGGPAKKLAKDKPDLEEAIEEEDEADLVEPAEVNGDEGLDMKGDKYIKQPKAKGGKKGAKKATKADGDDDDAGAAGKGAKGKAKPKAAAGRGKAKK